MNAPMLVVQEESFKPTPTSSAQQSANIVTRILKESDLKEGGSDGRFMVINEKNGELSWYDATAANPGWEGEDWKPATEGREANQPAWTPRVRPRASCWTTCPSLTVSGRRCTRKRAAAR